MLKLYHASSVIERLEVQDTILQGGVVHWFYADERRYEITYPDLIAGYAAMHPVHQICSTEFLDELFTADDIDALADMLASISGPDFRIYGNKNGLLQTRKVEFPISGGQLGYRHRPVGGNTRRIALNQHKAYNLPFAVQGYIDISEVGNETRLQESTQYVRRILQALGVDASVKLTQIESVVTAYFKQEGLYVTDATSDNTLQHVELPDPQFSKVPAQ